MAGLAAILTQHMRCSPWLLRPEGCPMGHQQIMLHAGPSAGCQGTTMRGAHLAVNSYWDMTSLAVKRFCLAHHSAWGVSRVGTRGWIPLRSSTRYGHLPADVWLSFGDLPS